MKKLPIINLCTLKRIAIWGLFTKIVEIWNRPLLAMKGTTVSYRHIWIRIITHISKLGVEI
jgi:hypothetical protein